MKATYSLIKHELPGPLLHEGTGYTASLSRMRMYVWFVEAPVDEGRVEEEVDVDVELV